MKFRRMTARGGFVVIAGLLALAAACGGGSDSGTSGNTGAAIAPNPAGGGGAAPVSSITTVATDNKFDQTSHTVKAGEQVTVTLENKGQALHNWVVKGIKGADGKDITTQLLTASKSETITFAIEKPGTYDFLCDVHPVEMKGKLTVQ